MNDDLFAKYGIKKVQPAWPRSTRRRQSRVSSSSSVSGYCRSDEHDKCSGWRKGGKCRCNCHSFCECEWEDDLTNREGKCLGCGKAKKTERKVSIKEWDDEPMF